MPYQGKLTYEPCHQKDKYTYFCKKHGYDYLFERNIISLYSLKDKDVFKFVDEDNKVGGYCVSGVDKEGILHAGIAMSPLYRGKCAYDVAKKWLTDHKLCYNRIEANCYKFNRLSYYFCLQLGFKKFKEDYNQYYLNYEGNS